MGGMYPIVALFERPPRPSTATVAASTTAWSCWKPSTTRPTSARSCATRPASVGVACCSTTRPRTRLARRALRWRWAPRSRSPTPAQRICRPRSTAAALAGSRPSRSRAPQTTLLDELATRLRDVRVAMLVGSERVGLSDATLARCDHGAHPDARRCRLAERGERRGDRLLRAAPVVIHVSSSARRRRRVAEREYRELHLHVAPTVVGAVAHLVPPLHDLAP